MIEFKNIPYNSDFIVDDWEEIINLNQRSLSDFKFSYCKYRIGDTVYTTLTKEFKEAFKAVKMWNRLKQ